MFTHLAVIVLADTGPLPLLSLQTEERGKFELDEVELMRLGIMGMTAIGLGTGLQVARHRLHGSFPVPERVDIASLLYPFNVIAENTTDNRLATFGREALVFLLFEVEKRNGIFALYGEIEEEIALVVRNIRTESEIKKPLFDQLLSNLNEMLSRVETSPAKTVFTLEKVEKIKSEITFFQEVIDLKLREQKNPIITGDGNFHLCEDFWGNEEDAEKLYDLVDELLRVDFATALEHVSLDSLYRIGNYHYHVAKCTEDRSEADMHLERALKYFKLACSIKEDPFTRISIGSVLFKRSRDLMARENVNLGIKLLRKAGLDESVLDENEIYRKEI
ncbi:MAG: hypothetical protein ACFFD4_12595 [Candidatus Odinarchaeota archaeon]